jgi:hypothetical protein
MRTWNNFIKPNRLCIEIAVDTEYEGNNTLTIQVAVRLRKTIVVQLYCDSSIPPYKPRYLPKSWKVALGKLGKVVVLPTRPIKADLSIGRFITDIFQLKRPKYQRRQTSLEELCQEDITNVEVTWISHFLPADLLRASGSKFNSSILLDSQEHVANLSFADRRTLSFTEEGYGRFGLPLVEYVVDGDQVYALRLRTLDTQQLVKESLDAAAASFLGVGKFESGITIDKSKMRREFNEHPSEVYQYAVQDAVLTLCLFERLEQQVRSIYSKLGISRLPGRLSVTSGRLAAELLKAYLNQKLSGETNNKVKELIKRLIEQGGARSIAEQSRFGVQTSTTQGGLCYSRSPTKFVHRKRGMLLDADLSHCYPGIIKHTHLYLGKPVVWEPGNTMVSLAKSVKVLEEHAAGDDAWFVRVSGKLPHGANALIRSVENAITCENYKRRTRRGRACLLPAQQDTEAAQRAKTAKTKSCLLTHEVNFGMITAATWAIIQTLPEEVRQEYESLRVESVVFYPRNLIADSVEEFEQLCQKFRTENIVAWRQALNFSKSKLETVEDIDDSFVSIRFPMHELMSHMISIRQEAGKDNALGKCIKLITNTMYGILASPLMDCNNVVAANVITDKARALAFAMHLSLNGIQVITDGVSFRRDQIPAGTLCDVLPVNPDYPLKRAEEEIPFLDPDTVPTTPKRFKSWYSDHVLRFFGVQGQEKYEKLFKLLHLDLKPLHGATKLTFDCLIVDGTANYLKLLEKQNKLQVVDIKTRSFNKQQQQLIQDHLKEIYLSDHFKPLEPVQSFKLARASEALYIIRTYAAPPENQFVFPLGSAWPDIKVYKLIKPTVFHIRDERQRRSFYRLYRKVEKMTHRGLEILALSVPGLANRRRLSTVAEFIYEHLREGKPLKNLNIDKRLLQDAPCVVAGGQMVMQRKVLRKEFMGKLLIKGKAPRTGLIVSLQDIKLLKIVS